MSIWTITHPSGTGTAALADLGISDPSVTFRILATSTATFRVQRAIDSEDTWWADDSLVTLFRDGAPFYTGRVQETPQGASGDDETRILALADAWQDLEEITYREQWAIGGGTFMYPRAILGRDSAGEPIKTGEQIAEAVAYAITQDTYLQVGTIDEGLQLWPSEVRNVSCESIITGELRFHPDWVAWIDHSTLPPTFHARAKSALTALPLNINSAAVVSQEYAEVKRNVPRGVTIVYESANTIDGEVYRTGYIDTAGATTGRRIIRAMLDLEGMQAQFQKSRIQTRTLPTDGPSMTAYFKKKWPELKDIPDAAFDWSNVTFTLAADDEDHAPPVNPKAERLEVETVDQLPRELVSGTIEDWMKVRVGRVIVQYDLAIVGAPPAAQEAILANFAGTAKTFSVTATNATTKTYTGCSSFTEGEGAPVGLAAAFLAAATAPQYQGEVSTIADEVPAGIPHAKILSLTLGSTALMPGAVIHSAVVDIDRGTVDYEFGPLPYLQPGDFLELQRLLNRRRPTWMSAQERTSNTLGSTDAAGSRGDTVGGYDIPQTLTPPGGIADVTGAFHRLITKDDGHTYLQGGTVTGGSGTETIADIKIIDGTTGPVDSDGYHLYLRAVGDGIEVDGLILPGYNLTAATTDTAAAVPDNTLPLSGDATGKLCHISLGQFSATGFHRNLPGNVSIGYCPGSYNITRT